MSRTAASPAERLRRLVPGLAWRGLALVAGVAWGLCHGASPVLLAPFLALAPFFLLIAGTTKPWRVGYWHGLGAWATALVWILPTLEVFGGIARPLAVLGLVLLASYMALYHAVFALLLSRLWRGDQKAQKAPSARAGAGAGRTLAGIRAVVGASALWVALEFLRTFVISGFPWSLAAYAVVETPGALGLSAWIGAYGVSAVVVFSGAALAWGISRWSRCGLPWVLAAIAVPALLLAVGARFGSAPRSAQAAARLPVRVIQPNIPNLPAGAAWDSTLALGQFHDLLETSRASCDPGSLLVWPESAGYPFALERDETLRRAVNELTERGCSLVLNSPRDEGERVYNSAYLASPGRPLQHADKRHLVPFGEYVPFRNWAPWIGKLARMSGDFSAAQSLGLLEVQSTAGSARLQNPAGSARLGPAICFEVIFPGEVAELVRAGATHLVTVTNDAWYGDTAAPWQHLHAARFRAAENRRPLMRAAITGVSAIFEDDGSVVGEIKPFAKGVLRGELTGRRDLSPYTRAPWLSPVCAVALSLWALAGGLRARLDGILRRP